MGRGSEEGERPVSEGSTWIEAAPEYGETREISSESGGPSPNPKYSLVTDSEPVP